MDLVILIFIYWALYAIFFSVLPFHIILFVFQLPVVVFYSLLFELLNNGRSLGKIMIGIRVVRVDGRPVKGYDYAMRWLFRWLDIYATFGTFAAIMVGATPRGQRLGDVLADTTVVQVKRLNIPLKRILNLSNLNNHVPQYPEVINLSEEQVVLIKEALDRAKKYNNGKHRHVIHELAKRLAEVLQAGEVKNSKSFLQTVIKDYIALTR